MNSLSNSLPFWIAIIGGLAMVYILPSLIAVIRNVENIALVIILNTLPVAWPAALLAACLFPRKEPRS